MELEEYYASSYTSDTQRYFFNKNNNKNLAYLSRR